MVSPEPRRRRLRGKQSGSRIGPRNTLDSFRRREHQHSCPGRAPDNLATIWQQHWRCQPNAAPMALAKSGDVTACHKANLTVSPTCFQRHVDGRRAGLKIRSSQEGVVQVQSSVLNLARSSRRRTRPPRHTPRASGTGPTSAQRASGTGRDLLVNRPFSAPGNGRQHSPWPSAIITSPIGPLNRPLSSCASGAGRLLQRPGGCARFRRGSAAGLIALRRTSSSILAPCHRPMS
jgi:hypothetical protein